MTIGAVVGCGHTIVARRKTATHHDPERNDVELVLSDILHRVEVFPIRNKGTIRAGGQEAKVVTVATVLVPGTEIGVEESVSALMVPVREPDVVVLDVEEPSLFLVLPDRVHFAFKLFVVIGDYPVDRLLMLA